jgi:AcrR family transcriptional regulator
MGTTREDILKSAAELFSERGYDKTTVRDICRHAGANVAAVNYHFKGKSGLGESVIDMLFENVRENQMKILLKDMEITDDRKWREAVYEFIYNFIFDRDREEYRNYYRTQLIFRELNSPSELLEKMLKKYMEPLHRQLIHYIRMGLPENASPELVSMWFLSIMSQCVIFRNRQGPMGEAVKIDFSDPEKVRMVTEHIAGIVYAGLKFRKGSGGKTAYK